MQIQSTQNTSERFDSAVQFATRMRPHIALAVSDVARSQTFYETLLGAQPAKVRPGYVKFEVNEPPLNLTLNQSDMARGHVGPAHFGVQVKSTAAVLAATSRLQKAGIATETEEHVTCCYAVQDKVWAVDPDGMRWEVFVVLDADAAEHGGDSSSVAGSPACCDPVQEQEPSCCVAEQAKQVAATTGCC